MIESALLLPMPRALLPHLSAKDPVADLREACTAAVGKLLAADPGRVVVVAPEVSAANRTRGVTESFGHQVARYLLAGTEVEEQLALPYAAAALLEDTRPTHLVVMADGSARRGEKAPGHQHPDAARFDDVIEVALRAGDAEALAALDPALGEELWCEGIPGFHVLGEVARGRTVEAEVTYADAPYGVAWWVAHWRMGERR